MFFYSSFIDGEDQWLFMYFDKYLQVSGDFGICMMMVFEQVFE